MIDFKDQIGHILNDAINKEDVIISLEEIIKTIERPPSYDMGDYAFPCFLLAKAFRKAPNQIAEDLKASMESPILEKVEAQGPYLNFFVDKKVLAEEVLGEVKAKKEDFGSSDMGRGKKVLVEYSSPNIAKPFHIGHLRSTVIGDSIKRIFAFLGYDTMGLNHLGDYGTQFGMLIEGINRYEIKKEDIEEDPIPKLLDIYVRINEEAENDEEVMAACRDAFAQLENGKEEYVKLWEWIKEVSLKEFQRVYKMLDISYDDIKGESFYRDKLKTEVDRIKEKDILVDKDGAYAVDLEAYKLPNPVVLKSNGSSMYMTRDIATAAYRHRTYEPYKSLYVVASEQRLYFEQLKAVLKEMGYDWYDEVDHVQFGLVSLKEGSLSTRKGRVVYLEDVLNQAKDRVMAILDEREEERGREIENKEDLAATIGIGAIKFQELFNQRIKDYVFDWDTSLSFEGETGPYVQYTHARISSILTRAGFDEDEDFDPGLLVEEREINLLRTLYGFTDAVIEAHEKYEPYIVTRYVTKLAQEFNSYYNTTQILTGDENLKKARLMLAYGVKLAIKNGLGLLGIGAPERM